LLFLLYSFYTIVYFYDCAAAGQLVRAWQRLDIKSRWNSVWMCNRRHCHHQTREREIERETTLDRNCKEERRVWANSQSFTILCARALCTLGETRRSGRDRECVQNRNCTWIDPPFLFTRGSKVSTLHERRCGAVDERTIVIVLLSVTRCAANRVTSKSRSIPFPLGGSCCSFKIIIKRNAFLRKQIAFLVEGDGCRRKKKHEEYIDQRSLFFFLVIWAKPKFQLHKKAAND